MLIEITELTISSSAKQGNLWKGTTGRMRRRLCAGTEAAPLLKQITCSFPCGINMILGRNGSGKSILLQVLDGLIQPDAGMVLIDGQAAKPPDLRQNIGYLPQIFGIYPKLTAWEMLDYIALLKGILDRETRKYEVENVLQQTGLLAVADQRVGVYSRGMRQKVGIAQALLGNPPVLILDEPTAGLDPEARNNLRGILAEVGQEQVIIWASSFVANTCCADRLLVLERGERRFWGAPAELAACAGSQKKSLPFFREETDEEHWFGMVEQGYHTILSLREN